MFLPGDQKDMCMQFQYFRVLSIYIGKSKNTLAAAGVSTKNTINTFCGILAITKLKIPFLTITKFLR